ncbi:MAG: VWA domain-containing protein [Myxococcaceae bacterium]|jgi:Ca-activated chloride channel family protein|nr:VWA domain-containing protein [Myxococcaceae bacterium]MCA3014414.1 VWA domain-containing protein [Myxococcaceae bacterium]
MPRPALPTHTHAHAHAAPAGGQLNSLDGRTLPLGRAALEADAKGGLVRVTLTQTFHNPHAEPLRVTYSLPLPADGAVSGFAFTVGDQRIVGEVDTRAQARARFEDAVLSGRTAALLDQERTSLFTQEVGNVPPRQSVVCELTIEQRLTWLPDGFWEWRFPTVVAPRYLGAAGRVADQARVTVDVADRALPVKLSLGLTVRDRLAEGLRPESPSHALHTVRGLSATEVTFADAGGASLDRDVVVRWRAAGQAVGVELDVCRPATGANAASAYGLLTLVPPVAEAGVPALARDLVVLLDTSGSMSEQPLDQARRFTAALVDSLGERDTLELVEFSTAPRRFKPGPVPATPANRRAAQAWLSELRASGGTEMAEGIIEALSGLRDEAQRQVVLITDGLIGSEHEVLSAILHRLPEGSRVHAIGVGSGVNRSLTQPAARCGRGVELVMGLGEDVEPMVRRLLARTSAPLLTGVTLQGDALERTAPARLPDVYAGAPALLSVQLAPRGGTLVVRGRTAVGLFERTLEIPAVAEGHGSRAVATVFARELVEDLEARRLAEPGQSVDAEVTRLGLAFQLSTRLTSWVAVSERETVDPRLPRRNVTQPHELAFGLSAEGVGLRAAASAAPSASAFQTRGMSAAPMLGAPRPAPAEEVGAASVERLSKHLRADVDDDGFASALSAGVPEALDYEAFEGEPTADAQGGGPRGGRPATSSPGAPMRADDEARRREQAPAPKRRRGTGYKGLLDTLSRLLPGSATRRLKARVLRRHGTRLDLELVVEEALDWAPVKDALLLLADGSKETARVNFSFTTANGVYGPGLVLTLTLTVRPDGEAPVLVTLFSAGQRVEVEIDG